MMLFIDRITAKAWLVIDKIVFIDVGVDATWYALGASPPRYPVPAIYKGKEHVKHP